MNYCIAFICCIIAFADAVPISDNSTMDSNLLSKKFQLLVPSVDANQTSSESMPSASEDMVDVQAPPTSLFGMPADTSNEATLHEDASSWNVATAHQPCCPEPCQPVAPPMPAPCVCAAVSPCQAGPTIDKASIKNNALMAGLIAGKIATAKMSAPIVLLNAKLAAGAAKLPFYWAKKGAVLGTAVALPVKLAAAVTSGAAVAANALVVGVPVGIGAGIATAAINAKNQLFSQSTGVACNTNPCPNSY